MVLTSLLPWQALLGSPALAFTKAVCEVLSLDSALEDEVAVLRRNLLRLTHTPEFSDASHFLVRGSGAKLWRPADYCAELNHLPCRTHAGHGCCGMSSAPLATPAETWTSAETLTSRCAHKPGAACLLTVCSSFWRQALTCAGT